MKAVIALFLSVILLVGAASPVSAGVEPSPFKLTHTEKQLEAMHNTFTQINSRLSRLPDRPPLAEPSPNIPDDVENWIGLQGMLNAISRKLVSLYNRLESLDLSSDDSRVRDALSNVRDASQRIVATVDAIPAPDDSRVQKALNDVRDSAQDITDLANRYLLPSLVQ